MKRYTKAYHLGHWLNLKHIRTEMSFEEVKRESSFLLYKINEESFIYIKDFGSVSFMNCPLQVIDDVLVLLSNETPKLIQLLPSEEYNVNVDKGGEVKVDFETIIIPRITLDFAHVILLNLTQSVALDHYYNLANDILETTKLFSEQLQNSGRISIGRKRLRMFVGKTMNLKNKIAENLFIFDSPQIAWQSSDLAKLDTQLKEELDILERHKGLQYNLDVIKENLDLFKDILQHKHSSMLEWIIIILILLEIVQVFIEK
ncbi:MAG: putative Rmd1/YagE family protein [Parvicellaceae bacterium]|jgi:uncharacterized Rmd1/YagE family protein